MKKLLMMFLCLGLFGVIGCGNVPEEDVVFEETDAVVSDVQANDTSKGLVSAEEAEEDAAEKAEMENKEPIDFDSVTVQAKKAFDENDSKNALKFYTKAIKANPEADWCYADRAKIKLSLGYNNSALKDITKAIEIQERKIYYVWRAEIYQALGNEDAANEDIAKSEKVKVE